MNLTDEFNRRLDFAKRELEEVGLGKGGLLYDGLQRLGIPIPPLAYSSFLLNFIVIATYWIAVMGTFWVIYVLVAARSLKVLTAASAILTSPEMWIGAMFMGIAGGANSVYRRWKYKLTKWSVI
jgi:hypothetical protein